MAENKVKTRSMTKSAVFQEISSKTNLTKKQVGEVFDCLTDLIKKELGKKGSGQFTLPGLIKLKLVKKPATKERMGRNPATGQPMVIKAKPARTTVRGRVLKTLSASVV
jgi:nucleoid DNA-binding protein